MTHDTAADKQKEFAESIISKNMVWALASSQGFVKASSQQFEDAQVIPFWSDEDEAGSLNRKGWENYKPASMSVPEFLENWLVGMYNQGLLVGINWTADASNENEEVEPLDLALEIANQLIAQGKDITLTKYKDIKDYHGQVEKILEQE